MKIHAIAMGAIFLAGSAITVAMAADPDTLPANQTAIRPQNSAIARPIDPVAAGTQTAPGQADAPLASNVAPVQNSGTVAPLSDQTRQSNPVGRPDPSGLPSVAPTATTGHPQPTPLSALANPPSAIATAKLVDSSGHDVGAVQTIKVGSTGKPDRVDIALTGTGGRIITLDASSLGYDASTNTLVTSMSMEALRAMPAKS